MPIGNISWTFSKWSMQSSLKLYWVLIPTCPFMHKRQTNPLSHIGAKLYTNYPPTRHKTKTTPHNFSQDLFKSIQECMSFVKLFDKRGKKNPAAFVLKPQMLSTSNAEMINMTCIWSMLCSVYGEAHIIWSRLLSYWLRAFLNTSTRDTYTQFSVDGILMCVKKYPEGLWLIVCTIPILQMALRFEIPNS